jgi:DNA-binding response OmpR family regulator
MQDGKHVILCIDDDQDVLTYLQTILQAEGYIFHGAPSAEKGLKAFDEVNPDLVIVDLMMEEVDAGTSFVKDVKAKGADLPIYMLSSVGDNLNMVTDYSQLGLDGVFQKPVAKDKLLAVMKRKLG